MCLYGFLDGYNLVFQKEHKFLAKAWRKKIGLSFHMCVPLFFSLYYMCASMCAMSTLCFKGLGVPVGRDWHQAPYAGKHNPSPTLRLNKLKLRCPSRKSPHENRSCSALRSGECNRWYLRTNKVAFHTPLISAALERLLGCTTAFFFFFFLLCGILGR